MVVYKITNKINGKMYIGQTINSLKSRFNDHCLSKRSAIGLAIHKYGKDNFIIETIYEAKNLEELNLMEKRLIEEYNTIAPNGYNLREGGNSKGFSIESRRKMSVSARSKPKMSDDTKQKISEAIKGEKHYFYGKKLKDEHKKILSDCAKLRTGDKNPMYGKNHTDEVKMNQSKRASGENNGQAKYTVEIVKELRYKFDNKISTIKELAEEYNIKPKTVDCIVKRRSWKNV